MIRSKISVIILISILLSCIHSFCYGNGIEQRFIKAGLIEIHKVDISIKIDLVNSDPDKNYFREDFYQGLNRAYIHEKVAQRLSKAQGQPGHEVYQGLCIIK